MAVCWACRHTEAEHKGGVGCEREERSEVYFHHKDGSTTHTVDLSPCGCPYFRGSLT